MGPIGCCDIVITSGGGNAPALPPTSGDVGLRVGLSGGSSVSIQVGELGTSLAGAGGLDLLEDGEGFVKVLAGKSELTQRGAILRQFEQ